MLVQINTGVSFALLGNSREGKVNIFYEVIFNLLEVFLIHFVGGDFGQFGSGFHEAPLILGRRRDHVASNGFGKRIDD